MARVLKKCIGCDQTYDLLKSIHCPDCGDFDEDIEIAKRANQEGRQARLDLEWFSQEANEKALTSPLIDKMRDAFGVTTSIPKSVEQAMQAYAEAAARKNYDIGLSQQQLVDLVKETSKRNKSTWTQLMERFSKMGK